MTKNNKTFDERINKLPVLIQKKIMHNCGACGTAHLKTVNYRLKMRIDRSYGMNNYIRPQYYIYYQCDDFNIKDNDRYIGEHCGMGFRTTSEALDDLERYLKYEQKDND